METHGHLSLRKNFSWVFFSNVIYVTSRWAIFIILTKMGNPELVGIYALAAAVVGPVVLLSRIQLTAVFMTDIKGEHSFNEYLWLRTLTTIISFMVIMALALFGYHQRGLAAIIIVVGLSEGLLAVREMFLAAMQKIERMDWFAISNIMQGIGTFLLFTIAIILTKNLIIASLGLVVARLLVFIFHDAPRVKKTGHEIRVDLQSMRKMLKDWKGTMKVVWFSLPVGITSWLISLHFNIPRYFLDHFYNEVYLGYYSALAALLVLGSILTSALGESAFPRLARYYSENRKAYVLLLLKLLLVSLFLGLGGILISVTLGKWLLTIFYTKEYAAYYKEFNWIVLAGAISFSISFLGYGLTSTRSFKIQMVIWSIIVSATTVLGYFLIPTRGMVGAAWSMIIPLLFGGVLTFAATFLLVSRKDIKRAK